MTQEQITVRQKIVIEMLDDAALGGEIEINEDVAAEDDVDVFHEDHAGIVGKVEAAEGNQTANRGQHLQLVFTGLKIFFAKVRIKVTSAVTAVNALLGMGQGTFVEVGGQDFQDPAFQMMLNFFLQQHA